MRHSLGLCAIGCSTSSCHRAAAVVTRSDHGCAPAAGRGSGGSRNLCVADAARRSNPRVRTAAAATASRRFRGSAPRWHTRVPSRSPFSDSSTTAGGAWRNRLRCCWRSAWWSRASRPHGRSRCRCTALGCASADSISRSCSRASYASAFRSRFRPASSFARGQLRRRSGMTAGGASRTCVTRSNGKVLAWKHVQYC